MLTYKIKGDNFHITEAIHSYIEKRFSAFERFLGESDLKEINFTISKETAHNHPDAYAVEVKFHATKNDFFVTTKDNDVLKAIDEAKDELWREVTHTKGKKRTLFVRGARKIKNLAKDIYRWRPRRKSS